MKKTLVVTSLIASFVLAAASPASAKTTITLSGSTSASPLVASLIKQFLKEKGSVANFVMYQGGSDVGVADTAYGRVSIGMVSRDEKGADPHGLSWNRFARDAICLITNKSNPISSMTQSTAGAIFSGQMFNWSQVPGSRTSGTINLLTRTVASGTQDMFEKLFLGSGQHISNGAAAKASSGLIVAAVKANPKAIGYVSYGFTSGVNAVPYMGYACTLKNAKSGQYPGVRSFWFVTRYEPTGVAAKFITWASSSASAQRIVANGYVPIN
jgi:phosphate transport system substrate-binding protein